MGGSRRAGPARAQREPGVDRQHVRSFARAHPHLYRVMTDGPLPRAALTPGTEERAARPLVDAARGDTALARAVWAFAHGMVILELDGGFPTNADLEAAWRRGLAGLGPARTSPCLNARLSRATRRPPT